MTHIPGQRCVERCSVCRPSRKLRPESGIQASIMQALGLERDFRVFRNNVGVAHHSDGSRVVYGLLPGSADLIGILAPHGRHVHLEVKAPGSYATPQQRAWAEMVRAMGGFCCVVRSAVEARDALQRAREGLSE